MAVCECISVFLYLFVPGLSAQKCVVYLVHVLFVVCVGSGLCSSESLAQYLMGLQFHLQASLASGQLRLRMHA